MKSGLILSAAVLGATMFAQNTFAANPAFDGDWQGTSTWTSNIKDASGKYLSGTVSVELNSTTDMSKNTTTAIAHDVFTIKNGSAADGQVLNDIRGTFTFVDVSDHPGESTVNWIDNGNSSPSGSEFITDKSYQEKIKYNGTLVSEAGLLMNSDTFYRNTIIDDGSGHLIYFDVTMTRKSQTP